MNDRGFTLIELLAVVLIVGILTAVAVPQYKKSLERSRVAEALQLLPAIFDSRERLLTENGYSISEFIESGEDGRNKLEHVSPFSRLDVEMKGHASTPLAWETDNFMYNLYDLHDMNFISAELLRGSYKGLVLYYDGDRVTCCDPRDPDGTLDWGEGSAERDTEYNMCRLFVEEEQITELCRK